MQNVSYALLTGWEKKNPECQIMHTGTAKRKCVPPSADKDESGGHKDGNSSAQQDPGYIACFCFHFKYVGF